MASSIVAKILYTHSNKHVNHGGIPLIEDKTVLPTKVITFMGVEFDTENRVMNEAQLKDAPIGKHLSK
jgi:hypothetical protein